MDFPEITDPEEKEESICFDSEEIDFELDNSEEIILWIKNIIAREKCRLHYINYIFCSDEYLHKINVEYLQHDTLTDIITFPYAEPPIVESDLFISVERVKENAEKFNVPFYQELCRVIIHGVLHLCGYGDKSPEEALKMREKENEALLLLTQ